MHRLIIVLGALFTHSCEIFPQDIRPIAEIRFGGQYFFGDKLHLIENDGPYKDIFGIHGTGHGIFGEARWSHGKDRNRAIGLRVELERTPFGHAWITRVGDVWGQPISWDDQQQSYIQLIPAVEAFGTYTYDLFQLKRSLIQGNLGVGGAFLPGNERMDYHFDRWSIGDDEHPNHNAVIYQMNVSRRPGIIPIYRASVSIAFELPRQNRLYAELFHSGSFVKDAFRVKYTMYPGTMAESVGELQQSLGTLGLALSYGISHGPPKKPRYHERPLENGKFQGRNVLDTIGTRWTRNAIGLTYGHFWHRPFQLESHSGDLHTYGHNGRALALSYEHRLKGGLLIGGEAQYGISSFLIRMTIDHPLYVAAYGTSNTIESGNWNPPNMEFMLFAGHELTSTDRWRLDAHVLAGIAPGAGGSSGRGRYFRVDTISIPAFTIMTRVDGKINPMVGIRLNGVYRLGNHDRLMLSLEARTTLTDYYTGHFAIYPDPANKWEAQGKLRGKLAYAGVRLGYAIAWGPPRQPRWMRLKERYEQKMGE